MDNKKPELIWTRENGKIVQRYADTLRPLQQGNGETFEEKADKYLQRRTDALEYYTLQQLEFRASELATSIERTTSLLASEKWADTLLLQKINWKNKLELKKCKTLIARKVVEKHERK